jgi:protein-tyrosine-phosphatase
MKILFVCMANIVRSFMAERILKGKLEKINRTDVDVSSAGLIDMDSMPADPIAAGILNDHGFEGSNHHSQLLTEEMISQADMIIVMEDVHRQMMIDQYPDSARKISLLRSFSRDYNVAFGDIKDPYKLSMYHYRLCFSEIYLSIDGLLKCI